MSGSTKNKPELWMYSMIQTAEVVSERYNISREAQDEYALSCKVRCAPPPASRPAGSTTKSCRCTSVKLVKDKETGEISEAGR